MAKVFLDANYFIGLVNRTPKTNVEALNKHSAYISCLSCHILFYVNKIKVPDEKTNSFINDFIVVNLTESILKKALGGPTPDLEDNIQLHSAAASDCNVFLTSDAKLLQMKFFGKSELISSLSPRPING